jgi:transcriptional regulator with XRE-family HTH domain
MTMSVSQDLRAAVNAALARGVTRYKIAKRAQIDHTALSRFLAGTRDARLSTVDALAEVLDLELRPKNGEAGL